MLRAVDPEAIDANLVALTDVDECERDPHAAYLLNARVVESLVAAVEGDAPAPVWSRFSNRSKSTTRPVPISRRTCG